MQKNPLIIGSHVSFLAKEGLLGSVKEALSFGENAFMIYTGAPQNTIRHALHPVLIAEGLKLWNAQGYPDEHIIVHAPYVINLCSEKEQTRTFGRQFLEQEIARCQELHVKYMVLHPGSRLKQPLAVGLQEVIEGLKSVLPSLHAANVTICLETMAGKGSEVGVTIEQMATIIKGVNDDHIGVCVDTCHINDAGYDLHDFDGYLDHFDALIGIDRIKVIHLNDSKNPCGAHKDRHENIGYGTIGFDLLMKVAYHPRLATVPKILETPWFDGRPIYKEEVAMIRANKFEDLRQEILAEDGKESDVLVH